MQTVISRFVSIKPLHTEVDILFILVLPAIFLAGYFILYAAAFASMTAHELGHIACAAVTGGQIHRIRILPVGLNASIDNGSAGRPGRILTFACGPLTNALLCMAGLLLDLCCFHGSMSIRFFIISNACLAVFNLLPVLPLDGGKILRELMAQRVGFYRGNKTIRELSYLVSALLILLGIYQAYRSMHNLSLLLIGLYLVFALRSDSIEEAAFMTVKDVIYRRSRFLKKGIYPVRDLVVLNSMQLGEIIKHMDFDRFHFVHVLDEEMKLLAVFTEQEIIDGMLEHSAEISFEEFMKVKR